MLATAGVAGASAASASTVQRHQPPRAAYGSVELGSPLQYETFLAFQGSAFHGSRFHGSVDYTNWTYAEPGSGVFAPAAGSHALVFTYQGSHYARLCCVPGPASRNSKTGSPTSAKPQS